MKKVEEFRKNLQKLPREELLKIIKEQDQDSYDEIRLIEWVFENKMSHLNWQDGTPIEERPFTQEELSYIVDPPFMMDEDLTKMGLTKDQQMEVHIVQDRVLWSKHYLGVRPRVYQVLVLRHPNLRKVMRWGRRLGKTYSMAIILLHYAYTNNYGRCLVMAPMKSQVKLIYDEVMKLAEASPVVKEAIKRNVTAPQYEIELTNKSTIRFFTTGMKSGGKSDNVRGQEAHVIILDEMDYMGPEDTVALLAMLQKTDANQPDKMLIAASTPTGRREKFYDWCVKSKRFKEFWFPSYCNPEWTDQDEEEYREEYTEMQYRHEIEADWGEDAEGVYPRKWVDRAFLEDDWAYHPRRQNPNSNYIMGVDWDKYGAGPNILVLEICGDNYEDERLRNKLRVVYRKEITRSEFVLTEMVEHIIELNHWFNPEHIYVDRGSGEVQVELLHQYGLEHPQTGLRKKVTGVSFSETIEVRDPATKRMEKKHIKPFMVENLRWLLEKEQIVFPERDEELYMQLTSYVVVRVNESGRPVFEASGTQQDHAHDALILACLAYKQHYDALMRSRVARFGMIFPSGVIEPVDEDDMPTKERIGRRLGSKEAVPVRRKRALVQRPQRSYVPLERKKWW